MRRRITLGLAALTILLPIAASALTFTRSLDVGATGQDVSSLQQFLKSGGYFSGDVTGFFGPLTKTAVSGFQKANGLEGLGMVGPKTIALLNGAPALTSTSGNPNQALIDALLVQIKILQAKIAEILAARGIQGSGASSNI